MKAAYDASGAAVAVAADEMMMMMIIIIIFSSFLLIQFFSVRIIYWVKWIMAFN